MISSKSKSSSRLSICGNDNMIKSKSCVKYIYKIKMTFHVSLLLYTQSRRCVFCHVYSHVFGALTFFCRPRSYSASA